MAGGDVQSGNPAAGTTTFYNQDAYRNQFGSSRDSGAGHTGIRNKDDELVQKEDADAEEEDAFAIMVVSDLDEDDEEFDA